MTNPGPSAGQTSEGGRRYVRYCNPVQGRSGTLWEGRFKASLVRDTAYRLQCYSDIERHPVRAGMVPDSAAYRWSSDRADALGIESDLCTPHEIGCALGQGAGRLAAYRALFAAHVIYKRCARPPLLATTNTDDNDSYYVSPRKVLARTLGAPPMASAQQLYIDHHDWLWSWLRRRLGCPERASDVAHDTFYRVLARGCPSEARQPRALLTRIATRLLIDRTRRERLERAYLETAAVLAAEHASAPAPEDIAEVVDALEEIARRLEGLADKPRRAFLMSRLDGLRQADIARELGVSVSMVKQYVAQAMVHCYYACSDPMATPAAS